MNEKEQLIDNKYILGYRSLLVDNRRNWEDRVFVDQVQRRNGSKIILGIVADGVGSADGSVGAQIAYDKAKEYILNDTEENIPLLIKCAMEYANTEVYLENQRTQRNGLTTLVVAIVANDRLYVGNVGDSRAYWVQSASANKKHGKMLQLTRDHTYYSIYGGDPDDEQAGSLINSIGNSETVQVDLGFYLKGPDPEKAYELGLTGLPLKPGDSVLLCSDGLIKSSPNNVRYVSDDEIIDAIETEYETNGAVIKMISWATGRMPDDNVSALTVQYLSPEMVKQVKARSVSAQRMKKLRTGLLAFGGVALLAVIAFLVINLTNTNSSMNLLRNQPTQTAAVITSTAQPTLKPIQQGQAYVDRVSGNGANITSGQTIENGTDLVSGDGIVAIRFGESTGRDGFIYLFPGSIAQMAFGDQMQPSLISGAIYIQPGSSLATVNLDQVEPGMIATVSGSRMVVQVEGDEIRVFCFKGKCLLEPQDGNPMRVPEGFKMVYHISSQIFDDPEEMTYSEEREWNTQCLDLCLSDFIPTPTQSKQTKPGTPTFEPSDSNNSGLEVTPTPVPTNKALITPTPPIKNPTTQAPTTQVPTTQVPTTQVPTTPVPTIKTPPTDTPVDCGKNPHLCKTPTVATTEPPLSTTEPPVATTEPPVSTTEPPPAASTEPPPAAT
jgi:serine/threonine protein phosphatase PrpC